jgi:hypothetical protein
VSAVRQAVNRFFGRGAFSITVPPMDGNLLPNRALDLAEDAQNVPDADSLAIFRGKLVAASGNAIREPGGDGVLHSFPAEITCLATTPSGALLAGLADGRIGVLAAGSSEPQFVSLPDGVRCPTALAALDGQNVIVANGSAEHAYADWKRDLLGKGSSGSVWLVSLDGGSHRKLADGLAFPYGLLPDGEGLIVSESWRSRLVRLPLQGGGRPEAVIANLPGYPARLARDRAGMPWLAIFAPRSQLVEFILREDAYRRRMLREVAPDYWIAPDLRSGHSFLEPLQQGGVKQLGVLKPWAPTRSYGLLVALDRNFRPARSYHSRADGRRHGVTDCLAVGDRMAFCAKGDGVVAFLLAGS